MREINPRLNLFKSYKKMGNIINPYVFVPVGIVTNGLKLYLDAGNSLSYPGSGTTWNDISGVIPPNNSVIVNGAAYNSANGGVMSFDGVNDRVDVLPTTTFINTALPFTLSAWVKLTSFTIQYPSIFSLRSNANSYDVFLSSDSRYLGVAFGAFSTWGRYKTNTPTSTFVGNWVNVTITYTGNGAAVVNNFKAYINGVNTSIDGSYTFANPPNTLNTIGCRNDRDNYSFFKGLNNDNLIYNIALTADEVLQNFNATKSKYGL